MTSDLAGDWGIPRRSSYPHIVVKADCEASDDSAYYCAGGGEPNVPQPCAADEMQTSISECVVAVAPSPTRTPTTPVEDSSSEPTKAPTTPVVQTGSEAPTATATAPPSASATASPSSSVVTLALADYDAIVWPSGSASLTLDFVITQVQAVTCSLRDSTNTIISSVEVELGLVGTGSVSVSVTLDETLAIECGLRWFCWTKPDVDGSDWADNTAQLTVNPGDICSAAAPSLMPSAVDAPTAGPSLAPAAEPSNGLSVFEPTRAPARPSPAPVVPASTPSNAPEAAPSPAPVAAPTRTFAAPTLAPVQAPTPSPSVSSAAASAESKGSGDSASTIVIAVGAVAVLCLGAAAALVFRRKAAAAPKQDTRRAYEVKDFLAVNPMSPKDTRV